MQDLFKDEKYESLDEISQMIEPFESSINEDISLFPDELIIGADIIYGMISHGRNVEWGVDVPLRKIIEREAARLNLKMLAERSRTDSKFVSEFFKIEMPQSAITFNAETGDLSGEIKIVKTKIGFEDSEIQNQLKNYMQNYFSYKLGRAGLVNKSRINEILDLFGNTKGLSTRKASAKVAALYNTYVELLDNRSLNIKDVALFHRFVQWNTLYIVNGSLPALSNITKIKIMMRKGLPIYSIKEEIV